MTVREHRITPAKQKRLVKTLGPIPAGYTTKEIEQFLDLVYGMYSHAYTLEEIHKITISDPFDQSETPRSLKLIDLTDWLEALIS